MSRAEIKQKFDEIAAFAEVERFLDTPVKRYSSGMQVRLAFAVAAHLEPEILIVDEVLAVGDLAFQKKCLGRMRHVASQEGRTVLFVSHNTGALSNLCSRGVVLDAGVVQADTDIHSALSLYLKSSSTRSVTSAGSLKGPRIESVAIDEAALQRGDLRPEDFVQFALRPRSADRRRGDHRQRMARRCSARIHGCIRTGSSAGPARSGVLEMPHTSTTLAQRGIRGLGVARPTCIRMYDAEMGLLAFHFSSPDFRPEIPPISIVGPVNVRAEWRFEEKAESVPAVFLNGVCGARRAALGV